MAPASLAAYARYLVLTQSDDPSEHRARDLARRAADRAPTIPRCLLAGELAENRNQRAIWIAIAGGVIVTGAVATFLRRKMSPAPPEDEPEKKEEQ